MRLGLSCPALRPLCSVGWSAVLQAAKDAERKEQRELKVRLRLSFPALSLLCSVEWSAAQFPAQLRVPAQCRSVASEPEPERSCSAAQ